MSSQPAFASHVNSASDLPASAVDRLWSRVAVGLPDECWPWLLSRRDGYGILRFDRDGARLSTGAHRAAYVSRRGAIPPGLVLDHLCRNRACCNPSHLEPVTNRENARRGDLVGPRGRYCRHGHELAGDNLNLYSNGVHVRRVCRACALRRSKESKARHASAC